MDRLLFDEAQANRQKMWDCERTVTTVSTNTSTSGLRSSSTNHQHHHQKSRTPSIRDRCSIFESKSEELKPRRRNIFQSLQSNQGGNDDLDSDTESDVLCHPMAFSPAPRLKVKVKPEGGGKEALEGMVNNIRDSFRGGNRQSPMQEHAAASVRGNRNSPGNIFLQSLLALDKMKQASSVVVDPTERSVSRRSVRSEARSTRSSSADRSMRSSLDVSGHSQSSRSRRPVSRSSLLGPMETDSKVNNPLDRLGHASRPTRSSLDSSDHSQSRSMQIPRSILCTTGDLNRSGHTASSALDRSGHTSKTSSALDCSGHAKAPSALDHSGHAANRSSTPCKSHRRGRRSSLAVNPEVLKKERVARSRSLSRPRTAKKVVEEKSERKEIKIKVTKEQSSPEKEKTKEKKKKKKRVHKIKVANVSSPEQERLSKSIFVEKKSSQKERSRSVPRPTNSDRIIPFKPKKDNSRSLRSERKTNFDTAIFDDDDVFQDDPFAQLTQDSKKKRDIFDDDVFRQDPFAQPKVEPKMKKKKQSKLKKEKAEPKEKKESKEKKEPKEQRDRSKGRASRKLNPEDVERALQRAQRQQQVVDRNFRSMKRRCSVVILP